MLQFVKNIKKTKQQAVKLSEQKFALKKASKKKDLTGFIDECCKKGALFYIGVTKEDIKKRPYKPIETSWCIAPTKAIRLVLYMKVDCMKKAENNLLQAYSSQSSCLNTATKSQKRGGQEGYIYVAHYSLVLNFRS
jgi:hypothetical protein